jgi:hypothetical protein
MLYIRAACPQSGQRLLKVRAGSIAAAGKRLDDSQFAQSQAAIQVRDWEWKS